MNSRIEYEMTEKQLEKLMESCSPVIVIIAEQPLTYAIEKYAYAAWEVLGAEMGFDYMTVRPVKGADRKFFTAELSILLPCPFDGTTVRIKKCVRDESIDAHRIECDYCGIYIIGATKGSTIGSWNRRKS